MDVQILTEFFMWCTIINAVLLIWSFVICALAGDLVYRIHTHWYSMPRETFTVVIYSLLGCFKVLFIVFNVVPWMVLLIVG